jgi:hypothetical protein
MVSLQGKTCRTVLSLLKKAGVVPTRILRKGSRWRFQIALEQALIVEREFVGFEYQIQNGEMQMDAVSAEAASEAEENDWYTNYNSVASYHHY